jgi:hypothetical protein
MASGPTSQISRECMSVQVEWKERHEPSIYVLLSFHLIRSNDAGRVLFRYRYLDSR